MHRILFFALILVTSSCDRGSDPACEKDCSGRVCGLDPVCGESCGDCVAGEDCNTAGQCVDCTQDCGGRVCGPDPLCGRSCGECGVGEVCNAEGQCVLDCTRFCAGRECGDDGCGGECGSCLDGDVCHDGQCKHPVFSHVFGVADSVDVLFIVDNSGSMVAEQFQLATAFQAFAQKLEAEYGDTYHIAVVTTGMESFGCPPCDHLITGSCINETGEHGRFQDRLGRNLGTIDAPMFEFHTDPTCRVVTAANQDTCFYNDIMQEGIVILGINGCGYERGLAPVRLALDDLASTYNAGFLRADALLVTVVVSDEEDCGEVGDVSEQVPGAMGNICYYASKGVGPDGEFFHPNDPDQRTYQLSPVEQVYDFLVSLKGGRAGFAKFAAVTGVVDVADPASTTIEYEWNDIRMLYDVVDACTTPGCTGNYCHAEPGTRYVKLAELFGLGGNGFLGTICQADFTSTMQRLGEFAGCPRKFRLRETLTSPDDALVLVNDQPVPHYSCENPAEAVACTGPGDAACAPASCVRSWAYFPPAGDPLAPGGHIEFATHLDPCDRFAPGEEVEIVILAD